MDVGTGLEQSQIEDNLKQPVQIYDVVRWIGTILVVIGHSAYTTMLTGTGGIRVDAVYGRAQAVILLIVRLIYSFHMPMFVALSGALFYHTASYKRPYNVFVRGKVRRLLLPFLVTSLFWLVPLKALSGYWSESLDPIKDIILGQFIRFENNHLWYVVSLFWIFCLFQLLYKIKSLSHRIAAILFASVFFFVIAQYLPYNYFGIKNAMTHLIWFGGGGYCV